MTMTPAVQQAYARASTSLLQLYAIDLDHPSFADPIRLVNYKQNLTIGADEYTGMAMDVEESSIDTEADSTYTIQIDGVPGAVQPYLKQASQTFDPVDVTIRVFAYDVKTESLVDAQALATINLQSRNISFNKTTVSINMGYTNTANRAFPSQLYTPESNPGLV